MRNYFRLGEKKSVPFISIIAICINSKTQITEKLCFLSSTLHATPKVTDIISPVLSIATMLSQL